MLWTGSGAEPVGSGGRGGLAETDHAVPLFPLAAGFEEGDAFKTLEDIALGTGGAGRCAKTVVLRHNLKTRIDRRNPGGKGRV